MNELKKSITNGNHYIFIYFFNFDQKDLLLNPVTKGCLSQFFPIQFIDKNGRKYSDCIQYMMSQKAALFKDTNAYNEIMKSTSQYQMRSIGRKVKNFDQKVWNQHSEKIVFKGNYYKFSQKKKKN